MFEFQESLDLALGGFEKEDESKMDNGLQMMFLNSGPGPFGFSEAQLREGMRYSGHSFKFVKD